MSIEALASIVAVITTIIIAGTKSAPAPKASGNGRTAITATSRASSLKVSRVAIARNAVRTGSAASVAEAAAGDALPS